MKQLLCTLALLSVFCSLPTIGHAASSESPLVIEVSKLGGISHEDAQKQIELVTGAIKSELKAGHDVTIKNFGKFYVQEMAPRQVRNPRTGEKLEVDARRYAHFTTSDNFKTEMNPNAVTKKVQVAGAAPQPK